MSSNFYKQFEDRYRGSRELIKSRLRIYLPFVLPLKLLYEDCTALDLGCGRGEWLELLKESNIEAHGIDLDEGMLTVGRELGLDVEVSDAVSYIKSLPDESQAIITAFHVVEHIPFVDLQLIVQEALRVLKPAGLLILETPNPENLVVGTASFYLDPTHVHPWPHQLLSFVTEYSGYYRNKVLRLQEPPGLAKNESPSLFDIFTGVSPDYSIIAQKYSAQQILAVFDHLFEKEYGVTLETLVVRYEKHKDAKNQEILAELNSIRSQLNYVQNILEKLTAPVRFAKKLLRSIVTFANHGISIIRKKLQSN